MDILQLRGVLTLVLALGFVTSATGICLLDVDQPIPTQFKHPLLVRDLSTGLGELLHPELDHGKLQFRIPDNTNLIRSCPGDNNVPNKDLTCKSGVLVYSQKPNPKVDWKGLECPSLPRANIKGPGNGCGNNGLTYKIGWDITPNLFVPLIEICFDANKETTEYTMHEIKGRSVGVKMVSPGRPSFRPENMFTVDVAEAYRQQNAKALFKKLLGTDEYLTVVGAHFLSKGHLTPDADFFYSAEQAATYFYGNAVPQWQCPNNCNWKRVESAIKILAEVQRANFRVWTGTYGTLEFPKDKNNNVRMFLGLRENVEKIPVPAVMWKVIQNLVNNQAVAIVTVNEMRGQGSSSDIGFDISPCNNICDELKWIDWDTLDEVRRGRTYCCGVSDLRKKITTLPNLGTVSLLNGSKKRPRPPGT